MPVSPVRPSRRVHLGSPVVPVNPSATYLRHRAAAERAYSARRRTRQWRRLLLLFACGLLYFAIGRDLIALVLAKRDAVAMEVRRDVHALGKDVESIIDASRAQAASEITSPLAFTSAAALASAAGPSDLDALLSGRPIDFQSRVQR